MFDDPPEMDNRYVIEVNTMRPKVTVLMALYNKGGFVEEAVKSVLDQSFTDVELLVVDDGSTDDGPARLKVFADNRIRIIESHENTGAAAAHDRGHAAAQGEFIAVLGADDVMLPNRLEEQVAFLDAHPEVGVCGSWVRSFGAHEEVLAHPEADAEIRGRMLLYLPLTHGACMIRRSVLEASGVRPRTDWRRPGFDYLFLAELAQHTRMANIPEVLTLYRTGVQNMRHGRDLVADREARIQAALALFGLPHEGDEARSLCQLEGSFAAAPTPSAVVRLDRLLKELLRLNAVTPRFPQEIFRAYLMERWRLFFHHLAPKYPAAAWTHLAISTRAWSVYAFRTAAWGTVRGLPGLSKERSA